MSSPRLPRAQIDFPHFRAPADFVASRLPPRSRRSAAPRCDRRIRTRRPCRARSGGWQAADRAASGIPPSPATRRKTVPRRARRAGESQDRWRGPERSRSAAAPRAKGCAPRRPGGPSNRRFPEARGPSRARRDRSDRDRHITSLLGLRPMIASSTLSSTVSFGKRLVTWNVRAMPSAVRRWLAQLVMSSPLSRTSPELAGNTPVTTLNSVVLPAPFGPMIALRSPGKMLMLTSWTARNPPKLLDRPFSSRTACRALTRNTCKAENRGCRAAASGTHLFRTSRTGRRPGRS